MDKIFCNVHLFVKATRSWTGSGQMKSSMTFIRGNRCIETERKIILEMAAKSNFKGVRTSFKNLTQCLWRESLTVRQIVFRPRVHPCVVVALTVDPIEFRPMGP